MDTLMKVLFYPIEFIFGLAHSFYWKAETTHLKNIRTTPDRGMFSKDVVTNEDIYQYVLTSQGVPKEIFEKELELLIAKAE